MLDSIVKVNITRETKVPTQTGFGIPAILSKEAEPLLANRVTTYSSDTILEDLVAAGFTTASQTYKAAAAIIAQNPKVETIKVITQAASIAQEDTITITVANDFTYQVTINGALLEFLSDADATDLEIQAGLIALIDALTDISAVANGTDAIDISSDVAGKGYSVVVGTNLVNLNTVANLGPVEEIISARDEDDDWYFLLNTTHTNVETLLIAAYVETQIKLFGYQTDDADSKDNLEAVDTTGLMKLLADLNYDRTFGVWVPTADLPEYKIAAWVGIMAPKDPGSATWKFKTGKGITADSFTTQEKTNIQDKNGNVYISIAGIDMFEEGVMASGEFIDIMRGTDWIQARIQEQVFGLLTTEDKVAYDDGGIESIGLQVSDVLDRAADRNILLSADVLDENDESLGPAVTVPKRSETTTADRANRFLRDVKFTGFYAGAIHKVQIDGTLSV